MQRILLLFQSLQAALQAIGGEGIKVIAYETAVGRHLLVKFEAFFAHGAHRWISGRERAALSVTDYSQGPRGDNEKRTPICRVPDIVFWPMLPNGRSSPTVECEFPHCRSHRASLGNVTSPFRSIRRPHPAGPPG